MTNPSRQTSDFDDQFRASLIRLFQLRRDVRHFQTKPVPIDLLKKLVRAAKLAPSVGLSEPWRLISVESSHLRAQIADEYVAAIQNFWLAARAEGVGVGWVSIFRPERVTAILQCPSLWRLVAYLCVGYPVEEHETPELERLGWENRDNTQDAWQVR